MKRTLKSYVIQEGYTINANHIFEELKKIVEEDEKNGIEITRRHPAKRILNKFSGRYISPTMVKGYYDCAAGQLVNSLFPYDSTKATSVGTTTHLIFQKFYELEGKDRTMPNLDKITEQIIEENHEFDRQKNEVRNYVKGFKKAGSYLGGPIDHQSLNCFPELFIKETCSPLGVTIPLPIYNVIDRVDFLDSGCYILDYKTGTYLSDSVFTYEGYLPQFISYCWSIEAAYGEKVKKAFMFTPGIEKKYHEMDINNIKLQSMYIEKLYKYCDDVAETAESRIYQQNIMPYCNSCNIKSKCNRFNRINMPGNELIEIEYDISLTETENKEETYSDLKSEN